MEYRFTISEYGQNFETDKMYADSTVCYNDTYKTEKEALRYANIYIKEHSLKGYLIRIWNRKSNSDDEWELLSRYGA